MLYSLVKMVKTEEYAKEFLKGSLHANSLKFFRDLEEDGNRADRLEGGMWFPEDFSISIGNFTNKITPYDVEEPPIAFPAWTSNLNIFCMYALHFDNPEELSIDDSSEGRRITLPDACIKEFGEFAVAIKNVTEFQKRVLDAVKREYVLGNISRFRSHYVEYRPPLVFQSDDPNDFKLAFRKGEELSYQREYRFAFQSTKPAGGPIKLNIGDISDIAIFERSRKVEFWVRSK